MEPKKIELLKQRALAFKETTQKWSEKTKQESVSCHLTDSFNKLVKEIVEIFPHLGRDMPPPIYAQGLNRKNHKADINYLDLEIYADQVIRILKLQEHP